MGPGKKRSRKIIGKLLGKFTKEDGFVESEKAKLRKRELTISKVTAKEFGVAAFIESVLAEYKELLVKFFPDHWQQILTIAYCKLVYQSPFKNVKFHYLNSYLSELYPSLSLSPKYLSALLKEIGI